MQLSDFQPKAVASLMPAFTKTSGAAQPNEHSDPI